MLNVFEFIVAVGSGVLLLLEVRRTVSKSDAGEEPRGLVLGRAVRPLVKAQY